MYLRCKSERIAWVLSITVSCVRSGKLCMELAPVQIKDRTSQEIWAWLLTSNQPVWWVILNNAVKNPKMTFCFCGWKEIWGFKQNPNYFSISLFYPPLPLCFFFFFLFLPSLVVQHSAAVLFPSNFSLVRFQPIISRKDIGDSSQMWVCACVARTNGSNPFPLGHHRTDRFTCTHSMWRLFSTSHT